MSDAWEVTPDDVATVFRTHGINKTDSEIQQIFAEVFVGDESVEDFVLDYNDFDDQVEANLFKIEDMLIEENLLPAADRKYKCPGEIDFDAEFDNAPVAPMTSEEIEGIVAKAKATGKLQPWHALVEIGNIITIKDGVVDENRAIIGLGGIVVTGEYENQQFSEALEGEYYRQCRAINPQLPASIEEADEDDMDDLPNIDDGYYEFEGRTVCLTHATKV